MTNCYKKGNYLLCLGVESIRFSTTCDHETEYSVGTKVNNPGIKKKKFDLYITYVIMWNIFFLPSCNPPKTRIRQGTSLS